MDSPDPQIVHALTSKILEAEKTLSELRVQYESLWGNKKATRKPRTIATEGTSGKILEFVTTHPNEDHAISFVATSLSHPEVETGKILYRLFKAGHIANPSRGRYRAKEKEAISEETTS